LSATPPFLNDLAQAIAIWKLHLSEPDPKITKDYDQALRALRDVASGALRIPGAAGVEPAATGGSGARITDRDRPLTAENMKGFI
jgi:phage gp36-like protein